MDCYGWIKANGVKNLLYSVRFQSKEEKKIDCDEFCEWQIRLFMLDL